MKRAVTVGVALAVLIVAGRAAAEDKFDPTGTWKWRLPNQSAENRLRLKREGDKLTGSLLKQNDDEKALIEEATYKDRVLTFKVTFISEQGDGLKIPSTFTGTVRGDTIKGTIEYKHPGGTISKDWYAKRAGR